MRIPLRQTPRTTTAVVKALGFQAVSNQGGTIEPALGRLQPDLRRFMRFCLRILACLLAFAWVPITQHCELAALGWLDSSCRGGTDSKSTARTDDCARDDCSRIEKGGYKLPGHAAAFADIGCFEFLSYPQVTLFRRPYDDGLQKPSVEAPLELGPTWWFDRQGALFPRAPSVFGA